jgi:hypothetical protein
MIRIEQLEKNFDLETMIEPKKKVFSLVSEINGSMLAFHKTLKTSKDVELLAESVFKTKEEIKRIKEGAVNLDGLSKKIQNTKPIKSILVDFI